MRTRQLLVDAQLAYFQTVLDENRTLIEVLARPELTVLPWPGPPAVTGDAAATVEAG